MKITQFSFENFKSFKDARINTLGKINFIYGENNSGKSNILKFINLIFQPKINTNEIFIEDDLGDERAINLGGGSRSFHSGQIDDHPYIYHKNDRSTEIKFEFVVKLTHHEIESSGFSYYEELSKNYFSSTQNYSTLKFNGKVHCIDNKSTSEINLEKVTLDGKDIFVRSTTDDNLYFPDIDESPLSYNQLAYQNLMSILNDSVTYIDNNRYFVDEKLNLELSTLSTQNFKNWLSNISLDEFNYDTFKNLLAFIRKNKIGSLKALSNLDLSFSVTNNNLELMLNNGSERLPISSFGTGVNQIFYILTQLFLTNSKIILIEELELNLSPKTQKELLRILQVMIADGIIDQVFFTSHSKFFSSRSDFSIHEVSIDLNGLSNITHQTRVRSTFFSASVL